MDQNRKSKVNLQSTKIQRSSSTKKPHVRSTHLLAKPVKRKTSLSKMAHSFSTLNSHNTFSKTHTSKTRTKTKQSSQKELSRQMDRMIDILKNQYQNLEWSGENKQNEWYGVVERVGKDASNKKLKLFLKTIQIGYCGFANKSNQLPLKKQNKLTLKIGNIKKDQILDYHDEFMSNADQFSPSWREMLKIQQKRTNTKHNGS